MKKPYQIEALRAVKRVEEMAGEGNPAIQMVLPMAEMVKLLARLDGELPSSDRLVVPSRTVRLPLSWDDPATLSEGQVIVKPCPLSLPLDGFSFRHSMLEIELECSDLDEGFFVIIPLF